MNEGSKRIVLIIEDGDEYLESLSRYVPENDYRQAHNWTQAYDLLESDPIEVAYLDMRFDRIPESHLIGDLAALTREHNGNKERALKFLQNNQGLYILAELRKTHQTPVVLAYDFTGEAPRFEHLHKQHAPIAWVPDAVTPDQIRSTIAGLVA